MALSDFKVFVQANPTLVESVKKGDMTWQKFYELYDLYGPESNVWNEYIARDSESKKVAFKDVLGYMKNIDVEEVRKGIENIQKVVSMVQGFGGEKKPQTVREPRPLYQHFED